LSSQTILQTACIWIKRNIEYNNFAGEFPGELKALTTLEILSVTLLISLSSTTSSNSITHILKMRMKDVFDPDLHFNRDTNGNDFDTITPDVGDLTGLKELFESCFLFLCL